MDKMLLKINNKLLKGFWRMIMKMKGQHLVNYIFTTGSFLNFFREFHAFVICPLFKPFHVFIKKQIFLQLFVLYSPPSPIFKRPFMFVKGNKYFFCWKLEALRFVIFPFLKAFHVCLVFKVANIFAEISKIGRAHVWTPVTL